MSSGSGKLHQHNHHHQQPHQPQTSPETSPVPMQQQLARMLQQQQQQAVSSAVMQVPPHPPPPQPQMVAAAPTDASIGLPSWAYAHPALMPLDPQTESLAENWRQFQQAAYNYNLDPHLLAMYGGGFSAAAGGRPDLMHGQRRKNATRETTGVLKAWLNEHKKNPYPTKGEKIMLAIITTMTLTQVSTWFANARRRLKKENKMTWVPRNRADEAADASATGGATADAADDEDLDDDIDGDEDSECRAGDNGDDRPQVLRKRRSGDANEFADRSAFDGEASPTGEKRARRTSISEESLELHRCQRSSSPSLTPLAPPPQTQPQSKPRIWSIVDTATKAEPLKASAASVAAAAAAAAANSWPGVSPAASKFGGVFLPHLFYAGGPPQHHHVPPQGPPPPPPMLPPFHQHQQHLLQHQMHHQHLLQSHQAMRLAELAAFSAFSRPPFLQPPPPPPMLSPQPSPPISRRSP